MTPAIALIFVCFVMLVFASLLFLWINTSDKAQKFEKLWKDSQDHCKELYSEVRDLRKLLENQKMATESAKMREETLQTSVDEARDLADKLRELLGI